MIIVRVECIENSFGLFMNDILIEYFYDLGDAMREADYLERGGAKIEFDDKSRELLPQDYFKSRNL